jgi:hypothetical protein
LDFGDRIGLGDRVDLGIALNKMDAIRPVRDAKAAPALAPVENYLAELHERVADLTAGKPADYIPELGKVDPSLFGIALATVDGEVYGAGDANNPFTIGVEALHVWLRARPLWP